MGAAPVALLVCVLVALPSVAAAQGPQGSGPPPPPNDNMGNARPVSSLPSSFDGTTKGATVESNEPQSSCASQSTKDSVWYSLRTAAAERIGVDLAAGGNLDAVVDVYHQVRSQLTPVACDQTDPQGKAALSFGSSKNGVYLIRVAALGDSQDGNFTLDVFAPRPEAEPPGTRLPPAGAQGQVDRVQNINAAYSVILHAGTSYKINLANETDGACVHAALFAPGTTSFDGASAVFRMHCTSYRLFTPGPGQGGSYSFDVTPLDSFRAVQRYHLEVQPAGRADTTPGVFLGNYAVAHGFLDDRADAVVRLYRFDVVTRSSLTLRLNAPDSADFDLEVRDNRGRLLGCTCGNSGSEVLQQNLQSGRYFAVVRARNATLGHYTLVRESRTITRTTIAFGTSSTAGPGRAVPIRVGVSPGASGPATVLIERFDPVSGWQFLRQDRVHVSAGSATEAFLPPSVGRYRASAAFTGTRAAAASASGFAQEDVEGPLVQ